MKGLSLGVAVAAGIGFVAGPVSAADMPVKAPPPIVMPVLYNWSGLYLGPEGGAVMGQRTDWHYLNRVADPICDDIPGFCANRGHPLHGGFVGGEAGINWQPIGSRWVFGIEGDGNWAELEEALTCAVFFEDVCGTKIRDFETVRARIGYAFGPTGSFLAYVTGGWATARVGAFKSHFEPPFPEVTQWQRLNGFVVGGGAEYGITPWLSLKGEVLYVWLEGKDYCFGNCQNTTDVPGLVLDPAHVGPMDFVLARMGLNWRFGWWGKGKAPAAVVASY